MNYEKIAKLLIELDKEDDGMSCVMICNDLEKEVGDKGLEKHFVYLYSAITSEKRITEEKS